MYYFDAERFNSQKTTHLFFICVILLLGTGLASLYSASFAYSEKFLRDGHYLIARQLLFTCAGLVLFFICLFIKLENIRKFILPLVVFAVVLCILPFVPVIGVDKYGATRWIEIGSFSYQPSEMVKFVLPLYLAHLLDKKQGNLDNFYTGILPPVLVSGLFFGLIYIQNNFSTAVFVIFNVMVIFFLAGVRYRYFLAAIAMIVPVSALLIFTKEHRVKRLVSFVRPEWDPLNSGMQAAAGRNAIVSGGFFGKGIGEGTRKIASVPAVHSDFIFASFVEETGFLGIIFFFVLFTVFAVLGYRAALKCETQFGRLLAAGLTTTIVSQVLLNVAVVSGALPVTGIPLPFFSAGGSSLVTTLICCGLIANIIRKGGKPLNNPETVNYNFSEDANVY